MALRVSAEVDSSRRFGSHRLPESRKLTICLNADCESLVYADSSRGKQASESTKFCHARFASKVADAYQRCIALLVSAVEAVRGHE